jgi:hypothetical protein
MLNRSPVTTVMSLAIRTQTGANHRARQPTSRPCLDGDRIGTPRPTLVSPAVLVREIASRGRVGCASLEALARRRGPGAREGRMVARLGRIEGPLYRFTTSKVRMPGTLSCPIVSVSVGEEIRIDNNELVRVTKLVIPRTSRWSGVRQP